MTVGPWQDPVKVNFNRVVVGNAKYHWLFPLSTGII